MCHRERTFSRFGREQLGHASYRLKYALRAPIPREPLRLILNRPGNTTMQARSTATLLLVLSTVLAAGCSTTSSGAHYKASTQNVISIQEKATGAKVRLADFTAAPGADKPSWCRAVGPVAIHGGRTASQFIHDALQEELFLAQIYSTSAPIEISGRLDSLSFSTVSPANWQMTLTLSSSTGASYQVTNRHDFGTSFNAVSACKNTADAFAPAVQDTLKKAIADPRFKSLVQAGN